MRKYKSPYDIQCEEPYNEDRFDRLEKEIIDILRPLKPYKTNVFKMYYGIDEYRYTELKNLREISESMIYRGKSMNITTIRRWITEIFDAVKKELDKRGYRDY